MDFQNNKPVIDQQSIIELTEAYLEERYGEPFTYAYPWDRGFGAGINLLMRCKSVSDNVVAVHAEKKEDDTWRFEDNFLPLKFQQPIRDFLRHTALTEFSDAYVVYNVGRVLLKDDIPANIDLEGYLQNNCFPISSTIVVPVNEFKSIEQAEHVVSKVADSGVDFSINIVSLEGDKFDDWNWAEFRKAISTKRFGCYVVTSNKGGAITYEWAEGDCK